MQGTIQAQVTKADSMHKALVAHKTNDSDKVNISLYLANAYELSSTDSLLKYAKLANALALKIDYQKGVANALELFGAYYSGKGIYDSALYYFDKSIVVAKNNDLKSIISSKYNHIANVYFLRSQYAKALTYYDSSKKVAEETNNTEFIAATNGNIASVYYKMGNYSRALTYYLESLKMQEKIGYEKTSASTNFSNIANVYYRLKQYDKAIVYLKKGLALNKKAGTLDYIIGNLTTYSMIYNDKKMYDSSLYYLNDALVLAKKLGDPFVLNIVKGNMAECYYKMGNYDKALELYEESLQVSNQLGDSEGIALAQAGIGSVFIDKGNGIKGRSYLVSALSLLQALGIKEQALEVSKKLASGFEDAGNYKEALKYYKIAGTYRDSLSRENAKKDVEQLLFNYEIQKKEDEIALLEKDNDIQQSKNNLQLVIIFAVSGVLILAIMIALLFFRSLRLEQKSIKTILKQKEEIEEQTIRLHELNKFKDNTFSVLSHDLRSPVNALTSTMMLLDENLITPEEFAFYKQELNEKLQSVRILLDNMLYWAQSQMKGELTLEIVKLYPHVKVQKAFLVLSDAARQKNITLKNNVPADLIAYGDKDQLDIVIRNLVSNAIKFTHRSGFVKVTAEQNYRDKTVEISITDNGVGMTDEQMQMLFSRAAHVSTKGTGGEKGTGLGLQLCYDIMQRNNGSIRVSSRPGLGSVFTIVLPAEPVTQ